MLSHILVWKRAEAAQNIDKKTILPDVYMVLACKYGKSLIKPAHDSASDAEKTLRPSRHLWNDWIQAGLEGQYPVFLLGWSQDFPGIFLFTETEREGTLAIKICPGGWTLQLGFV